MNILFMNTHIVYSIWNWHLHNLIDEDFEITPNITAPRYYLNTYPPPRTPIPSHSKNIVIFYDVDDFSIQTKCIHWLIFSWQLDPENQGYADISIASPPLVIPNKKEQETTRENEEISFRFCPKNLQNKRKPKQETKKRRGRYKAARGKQNQKRQPQQNTFEFFQKFKTKQKTNNIK